MHIDVPITSEAGKGLVNILRHYLHALLTVILALTKFYIYLPGIISVRKSYPTYLLSMITIYDV